jgi:hypothetical protein
MADIPSLQRQPNQRGFSDSYPSNHQASLSRGVHPSDLMRVTPKKSLRRHLSDRSAEQSKGYYNYKDAMYTKQQQQQQQPLQ